jgi:hypothetical protein
MPTPRAATWENHYTVTCEGCGKRVKVGITGLLYPHSATPPEEQAAQRRAARKRDATKETQ